MSLYEASLNQMLRSFETKGKCVVESGSDISIKFMVIAEEIAALHDRLAFYERQIFPHTADGEYLIKHGEAKGIFKKTSSKSTGTVTFKSKAPATSAIIIPAGTLLTSSKVPDATYQTTSEAVLAAKALSVIVPVESIKSGKETVIASGFVDILITPISGISEVINITKISGGSDSEPDELYKNRVIESYSKISNGANLNYYEQLAKTIDDVWYAKAIYKSSPINQIDIYVENYTRTISDSLIAEVQAKITSSREIGMNVTVIRPTKKEIHPQLTIKVDNLANAPQYIMKADQAVAEYISTLSIGEDVSQAKIGARVLSISGILDVIVTSPTASIAIADSEIAEASMAIITVTS